MRVLFFYPYLKGGVKILYALYQMKTFLCTIFFKWNNDLHY
jgi:hypothetical protein